MEDQDMEDHDIERIEEYGGLGDGESGDGGSENGV